MSNTHEQELELLAILSEECGEVQQAIGKALRHGLESTNPSGGPTNRESLAKEVGHVIFAVNLLLHAGELDGPQVSAWTDDKAESIRPYIHHNIEVLNSLTKS